MTGAARRDAAPGAWALGDEVHVWVVRTSPEALAPRHLDALSPEERAAARRFVFSRDRIRYVASHGALREILSRYSQVAASALRFRSGAYGKPELLPGSDLRFNLAHSADVALVAVARGRRVGIDVEEHRDIDCEGLARGCLSPAEQAALAGVPRADRIACFFRLWTRKEAYVKARGEGLSLPLDGFDVTSGPCEARLLATRPDVREATRWTMVHLDVGESRSAALVYERGPVGAIRLLRW